MICLPVILLWKHFSKCIEFFIGYGLDVNYHTIYYNFAFISSCIAHIRHVKLQGLQVRIIGP